MKKSMCHMAPWFPGGCGRAAYYSAKTDQESVDAFQFAMRSQKIIDEHRRAVDAGEALVETFLVPQDPRPRHLCPGCGNSLLLKFDKCSICKHLEEICACNPAEVAERTQGRLRTKTERGPIPCDCGAASVRHCTHAHWCGSRA